MSHIAHDREPAASRTQFGGAWLRLLGDIQGQPKSLDEFLGHLLQDLGATGLLWIPDAGSATWKGHYQARDVDWASLTALPAGHWRAMHLTEGLRRPWGATAGGEDW
ncbi:MAG: hypothetical protein P1V35_08180 [Planctomycetota bacterium]|nr:hypothetical protein [Planctomycetota bacterium]